MFSYILQRLWMGIIALLVVATATFILMHSVPGDPLLQDKAMAPSVRANLEKRYGLDKPIVEQYLVYMKRMFLQADFGISFKQANRSVNDIIKEHFPKSAVLGVMALSFAFVCGVLLGIIASINRNKWPDYVAMFISIMGFSVPSFVLAYLLQYVFALKLQWLPVGGWGQFSEMILPALSLGMIVMASQARLMRSSMLDVIQQDYIKTARSKGLKNIKIIVKHQIRNAILPVIIFIGPLFAVLVTGTFVIENIFGIPGLGQFFVSSVQQLDYTVIMGLTVFYAGFAITMALVVDILYGIIDPRIRLAK